MANTPVLDLDTIADRPTVVIRGKSYRLWSIDLLPPLDNHRVRKLLKRNNELAQKDELTKAEEKELKAIFDEITRIVLEAPDAVHAKLTDKQRAEIINVFQLPSLDLLVKFGEMLAAANPTTTAAPTSGSPSPTDSPASTQP